MPSSLDLSGRTALVTGSTRGIGWATAQLLAKHGAHVIVHGRSEKDVEERQASLRSLGLETSGLAYDVSQPELIGSAFKDIFARLGRLDILVNNAGVMTGGALGMLKASAVQETFAVNTVSVVLHIQEAARLMSRHKAGAIVNLASIAGRNGGQGLTAYSASKAAIVGITRSASRELAPRGVRVNAVAPGMIDTELLKGIPAEKIQAQVQNIALRRLGSAEEVAQAILFLVSDLAAYITGAVLDVDGGANI